jgi:hypothetical protein
MAYSFGPPKIVTDGLVLHLDAGNRRSYPGSGTTWTDLSGAGNNGTLTNGPTFNGDNAGSIVFDGVNDYTTLPTNFFTYPTLTTFTISLWFKSSQSNGGTLFGQQNTSAPSINPTGWIPVIYLRSDGYIRSEPFWTGNANNFILSTSVLNNNIWYNIVITFQSGVHILYVNGISNSQRTGLTLTSYTTTYYYFIGAGVSNQRFLGSNYFSGNISNFIFYNRALSATEIQQNFNSSRARYNI